MKKKAYKNFQIQYGNSLMINDTHNYEYNCSFYGCDSICRCGKIVNLNITKVDFGLQYLYTRKNYKDKAGKNREKNYPLSTIEKYCIDRLLRIYRAYDKDLYTLNVCRGYYGEEISGFDFINYDKMLDSINILLEKETDIEKIRHVLFEEYSYVLDTIEDFTVVDVDKISLDKIIFNKDYVSRLKKTFDYNSYNFETGIPVGVVKCLNDEYFLVDGYHRFLSMKGKIEDASYIIISQDALRTVH